MGKYKGFSSVELKKPTRSTFDLSHEKRVSSRMGRLTPILMVETMPNDTFYGSTEVLVKLAPLIAPIYHRLNLYVHYFFVPNRLLWKEWETFITGGRIGAEVTSPPVPPNVNMKTALSAGFSCFESGRTPDYLGIPILHDVNANDWDGRTLDMMPFAAFYRCWYDYYRDRNFVQDNDYLPMASGTYVGTSTNWDLLQPKFRCWEHDYFTSALPWTQRGAEVLMPIQGVGYVTYSDESSFVKGDGDPFSEGVDVYAGAIDDASGLYGFRKDTGAAITGGRIENIDEVIMDGSEVSINDLRRAVALQKWLERNALAGSRYNESIMAHFGRKTSDARLQRAEYLGGGKAVIQISEVMTTSYSEDADTAIVPPGNMAGRGSTYANTNKFSYNCEEHGFVVGILSVMPSSGYMQGIPRMFQNRNTFLEYPWPSFAHLGEQEVYDNEIYLTPASLPPNRSEQTVFGYQSRYADWKHIPSSTHGDFRSSLDFWHLTRKFDSAPTLGEVFNTYDTLNQDRVFNVSNVDTLWMYIYNKLTVKRSLPYFGTPQL